MNFLKDTNLFIDIPRWKIYFKLKNYAKYVEHIYKIALNSENFRVYIDLDKTTDFNIDMFMHLIKHLQVFYRLEWDEQRWSVSFISGKVEAKARWFKDTLKAALHSKEKYESIRESVNRYWIEIRSFSYSYDDGSGESYLVLPVAFHMDYIYHMSSQHHNKDILNTRYKYIGEVGIVLESRKEPHIHSARIFASTLKDERNKLSLIDPKKYTFISTPCIKLSEFLDFYNKILTKGKKLIIKKYILED